MADWKIEGAFTAFKYCHRFMNDCPKKDVCLRCDRNMLKNWISCVMSNLDCNEKNGYPYLLTEPPLEDELPKDYFGSFGASYEEDETEEQSEQEVKDTESGISESVSNETELKESVETSGKIIAYLNDVISHSRTDFYIEPFVGHSSTIQDITGIKNVLGTDIDSAKIESLKSTLKGSYQFKACDYKIWSKPLLSDSYKGKCIIYCEPPKQDSDKFNLEEFLSVIKEWAPKNRVFVRYSKLKRRKPVLEISENDFLYWM